ncbi:MAG: hypothetical protein U1F30_02160 [Steroidobacteraceae bacterium]
MKRVGGIAVGMTLGLLLAAAPAAGWDVGNSGAPAHEASFGVSEGTWMSLDVSPDGATIVFDLLGDIYRIPAAGGEAQPLFTGPAMQRSPVYSADGRRLLFLSDAAGSDDVWMANADGSGAHAVTHAGVDFVNGPAWGPDDQSVIAARQPATVARLHASELRLYDLRGGDGQVLVETPANHENVHEAELSPDGRYLYYTEKMSPPSASVVYIDANHANYAIRRRELASGATETLVQGFGGATTPRLSRDGRRLAFVRRVGQKTVLFVYDLATRTQRPVYDDLDRDDQSDFIGQGNYYPRYGWFPDNRTIAIWGKGQLQRVDVDAGTHAVIPFHAIARHRISEPPRFTHELAPAQLEVRALRHLTVAPAGDAVAFSAIGHLWQVAPGGAAPRRLTNGSEFSTSRPIHPTAARSPTWPGTTSAAACGSSRAPAACRACCSRRRGVVRQPAFSPDGRQLVYRIDAGDKCMGGFGGHPGLYSISVDGGAGRRIAANADAPRYSADGRRIYDAGHEGDDGATHRERATSTASTAACMPRRAMPTRWN